MVPSQQLEAIQRGIRLLFKPGWLVELRARTRDTGWRGFYFTDHQRLADVVLKLDNDPRVVSLYYVINPCKPNLIKTRAECQCKVCASGGGLIVDNPTNAQIEQILEGPRQHLTSNDDVENLMWLFIDVDTTRVPHLKDTDKPTFEKMQHECSTNEEKAAAMGVAKNVLNFLTEKGWPQPLLADSGNGYHILYRVNQLNTQHNIGMMVDVLKALKEKFDAPVADIDAAVFNPARLTRAYGSTTRKGTSTAERPYRFNSLKEPKVPPQEVTLDNLLLIGTEAPASGRRGDDFPELDPSFEIADWLQWYEDQGAFTIEQVRDQGGKKIHVTDVCLNVGRKHTGSTLSGFIEGDSFGYHCFSDECEGVTIGSIFKMLREAEDDDGNPLYKPYPKPIFKTETLEELAEIFGFKDAESGEQADQIEISQHSVDVVPVPPEEPGEVQTASPRLKVGRIKDLATWMLGTIFRNPIEVLPKFLLHKSHIESTLLKHLAAPIHETMTCLIGYFEDTRLLPSRAELLNWINDSSDPVAKAARANKFLPGIQKYVTELEDDPSKEFTVMVTELHRASELEEQRAVTRENFKKHLNEEVGDGDVQAFRIAERSHTQKELRSRGDILGKPIQEMTFEISQEFFNDVQGANDAGKFLTGIPAIDDHSHIGLHAERTLFIYGPANNGKTTLLMTIALNAAMSGKNGIIFVGEHQALPMMKTLALMLGHFTKDDAEIGALPNRYEWEGKNRTATKEDWERLNILLQRVRERLLLPGYLGVENISAIAGQEEDRLGAVIDYMQSFNMEYPIDFIVIDPLDQVMPLSAMGKDNAWQESKETLQRVQSLSRNFEGRNGKGLIIITAAQLTSKFQREIEKVQAKNATQMDQQDDSLLSLAEQVSQVQFFTTIPQDLDFGICIVTRVKGGKDGYIVLGRSRFGSTFKYVAFKMDEVAHIITTSGVTTVSAAAKAAAPAGAAQSMEAYDEL